jgi:hypothetical protein
MAVTDPTEGAMTYLSFHHMFARMRLRFARIGIQDFKAHQSGDPVTFQPTSGA